VEKVRLRHVNLRFRLSEDENGNPHFTTDGAGEIPIHVVPCESEDQWIDVLNETSEVPFAFAERPPIRFFLIQAPTRSDVVIVSHHIICDGMSLAYLARDLMTYLGDPNAEVEALPNPVLVTLDSIPAEVSLNPIARAILRRMNKKWAREKVVFNQQDYLDLTATYWREYRHVTLPIELSEAQTGALATRCKAEGVTVNTVLAAAFVNAQMELNGGKLPHPIICIAVGLRD